MIVRTFDFKMTVGIPVLVVILGTAACDDLIDAAKDIAGSGSTGDPGGHGQGDGTCDNGGGGTVDAGAAIDAGLSCQLETLADGVVCTICYDATGVPTSRDCGGTIDAGSGGGDPVVRCLDEVLGEGVVCKVCYDASGTPVSRECGGGGGAGGSSGGDPIPPLSCRIEVLADGVVCEICYDPATGVPVTRECPPPA